jgi:hypothetical protein
MLDTYIAQLHQLINIKMDAILCQEIENPIKAPTLYIKQLQRNLYPIYLC